MTKEVLEKLYEFMIENYVNNHGLDYESATCYVQYFYWEYTMSYIPYYAKKFWGADEYVISNSQDFYEHFMDFAKVLFTTDEAIIRGKYLEDLFAGKELWSIQFDEAEVLEGAENIDNLASDHYSRIRQYINSFWKNYVTSKNEQRRIKKSEELFWLIMAWIYVVGIRAESEDSFYINELKQLLCVRKPNKNVNKVIQWIVGCYLDLLFTTYPPQKPIEDQTSLLQKFSSYKYLGGIFDFSEYFEYKQHHVEELLADLLQTAFEKEIHGGIVGARYQFLFDVENRLQGAPCDFNDDELQLKGINYPISKKFRSPKHEGDAPELSYYTGGAKRGIKEYFSDKPELQEYLRRPIFLELNDELNEETAMICLQNYESTKTFLYRRFVASFFIRMWPSKDTYMSIGDIRIMLNAVDKMVTADEIKQAKQIESVRVAWDTIKYKFSDLFATWDYEQEDIERKFFESIGLLKEYEYVYSGNAEFIDDVAEAEKIQKYSNMILQIINNNSSRDYARKKLDEVIQNYIREGELIQKEFELLKIAVVCMCEIFNLNYNFVVDPNFQ